ncbi:spermidine/putrescine ABC transporter substrate-binding protein [Agromyces sp. NPDC057679]|uniref:polyamine ABC transporter substrate-binding protein n=1 Tax=Agromyces sp. NPDC057679 TaxID=3346207 RepID=UPI00366D5B6C
MSPEPEIRILAPAGAAKTIRRELSRRRFLSFAAAAGSAGLLAACAPSGTQSAAQASGGALEDRLSIYTWGDYDAPDVLDAFTADLGPKISLSAFNSNEEMVAKLVGARGTSGYDIVVPTGTFVAQMAEHGLLSKLNHDLIPNLQHVDPEFLGRAWDPDNEYSICKAWGTTGFVYDTTVIDRELKDWNDFIDAAKNEASGKTSLLDDPAELTGLYFWSNGIPWNTTDEAELAAAEAFLVDELAPHISAFDSYPGGSAIPQATQALMQSYNGDARLGMLESPDPERWKFVLGSPSTELWMDNWAIPAGAPHPEAAHAFIDYVLAPENAISELDYIGYHTGAKDIEQVAADAGLPMLDLVFFTPEQLATMQEGELTEAQERIVQIWNKTKAAAGA